MSFRTDALYEIHWPNGTRSVTPVQFLKRGETITPRERLFPGRPWVETRDSGENMSRAEKVDLLLELLAEVVDDDELDDFVEALEERRSRSGRRTTDARPRSTPTLDSRQREAEQFVDSARQMRRQALGQPEERPRSCRLPVTDAERSQDFVELARRRREGLLRRP